MISRVRDLEGIVQYVQKLESSDIAHLKGLHTALTVLFEQIEKTDMSALPPSVKENVHTLLREKRALTDKTLGRLLHRKIQLLDTIQKKDSLFDGPVATFLPSSFVSYQNLERGYIITFELQETLEEAAWEKLLKAVFRNESDTVGCFAEKPKILMGFHSASHQESLKKLRAIQKKLLGKEVLKLDMVRLPHWEMEPEALEQFIKESMSARSDEMEIGQFQLDVREERAPGHGFLVDDVEDVPLGEEPEIAAKYDKAWLVFCRDKKNAFGIAKALNAKFSFPAFGAVENLEGESEQGKVFYFFSKKQAEAFFQEVEEGRLDMASHVKQIFLDSEGFAGITFIQMIERFQNVYGYFGVTALTPTDKPAAMLQQLVNKYALKILPFSKALSVTK